MTRPPVLFLPGTLCTPSVFDSQISALVDVAPRIVRKAPQLVEKLALLKWYLQN